MAKLVHDIGREIAHLPAFDYVTDAEGEFGDKSVVMFIATLVPSHFGFVWRLIPDITFDGSSAAAPTAYFTVRPRQNPGANYSTSNNPSVESAQSYATTTTYNVQQFTQQVFVRIRGRQMAFKVSSSDLGTQWQLGAPRIDVRPDGRR